MVKISKERLDGIINRFEDWLNIYVVDDKNECEHTFKQFNKFCRLKQLPFKSCIKILLENKISCDCEIILNYENGKN